MSKVLMGLGAVLIAWGLYVLFTGDYVATLDIAASLVASGAGVLALANIAQALGRIAERLHGQPATTALTEEAPTRANTAEPEPIAVPDSEPDLEPPPRPLARSVPELKPAVEASKTLPQTSAAPELVREGVIEGRRYRFFADGSIEAEGPRGVRRYKSIEEAREQILRDRDEGAVPPPAPAPVPQEPRKMPPLLRKSPSSLRDIPPAPVEPRPAASTEPQPPKTSRPTVTWDSYLGGAAKTPAAESAPPTPQQAGPPALSDDEDEWSKPFRTLLEENGLDGSDKPGKT